MLKDNKDAKIAADFLLMTEALNSCDAVVMITYKRDGTTDLYTSHVHFSIPASGMYGDALANLLLTMSVFSPEGQVVARKAMIESLFRAGGCSPHTRG